MPDSDIPITAGTGTKVDTRTVGAGSDEHRQVVVLGDPATAANVGAVSAAGRLSVDASGVAVPVTDNGASLTVDGTFWQATQPVSGTFWQATQPVSGTVSITNFGGYSAPVTVTRPANTTAYAARDVVGGAITFPSMGPSAGRIIINSAQLQINIAALPAGMTTFFLYLYNVTPPSALADNAAFDIPSGDRASFLGKVALGTPIDEGATLYVEANLIGKQLTLAGTSLFGYLMTTGGFTPAANSEVYVVTLHASTVD